MKLSGVSLTALLIDLLSLPKIKSEACTSVNIILPWDLIENLYDQESCFVEMGPIDILLSCAADKIV